MSTRLSLFAELKRRNVIRMAGLYLVGAWLITQVSSTLLPVFEAPSWVMKTLVGLLGIGFVPTLVFSWIYELTPEGLRRDAEVPREQSIAPQTGRRIDRTIIVVLICALVYFAVDKFVLTPHRDGRPGSTAAQPAAGGPATQAAANVDAKSVAVLPFVNMSGDPANEYFSDGITEEILDALAQIADLKVAARTSAFAFKGKDPDLRKVGEILGVATVLEGSVQRAGDDVRITAQLIDARNGYHLWSEKYDRKLTNLFAIEDEISRAISDKLKVQFLGGRANFVGNPVDAQAHELYLRGLTLLAARGPGLRDAAEAFRQAVKLDPTYARAWGALAETEIVAPGYATDATLADAVPRAEAAAQRALAIDPDTASAHVALGEIQEIRRQWPQAEQAFMRALTIAPGDAEAVNQYAQFLSATGQNEAALRQIDRAHELDPLSAIIDGVRCVILMALRRDDAATAQLAAAIAAHPDFVNTRWVATFHYAALGKFAEAEAQFRAAARTAGYNPDDMAKLVQGMADPAGRAEAVQQLKAFIATNPPNDEPLSDAILLSLLGDYDDAVARIEVFAENPGTAAGGLLWGRALDPVRNDPRFQAAMKRMKLPYASAAGTAP